MNTRWTRALRMVGLLALSAAAGDASAQSSAVEVHVGETVNFAIPRLPMFLDTEDHAVATLVVQPNGQARVTGVAVGHTRIIGRDFAEVPMVFPVTVLPARP